MLDFLIFYEVKNREMESIILLRNELVRRGYTCDYVSFSEIYDLKTINKYHGKVVTAVVPSLYHNEEIVNIIYRVAGKVKYIVNLRWEQVFNNETESDPTHYIFPKDSAKNAIHCCWGSKPYEMLLNSGVSKDNAVITGPMHMDILSPAFTNYYMCKEELYKKYGIPTDKPTLLFISSFVLATYTEREIEYYLKEVGEDKRSEILKKLKFDRLSHQEIINWLKHVIEKYNYSIIYRPHPAENLSIVTKLFKNTNNIYIIKDLNVKQWMKTSDVVFTWVSTSIVEAFFAGIPCAILRPLNIPLLREMSVYNGANVINNIEELDEYFEKIGSSHDKYFSLSPSNINKYYDHDNGELSFIKVADLLCTLDQKYKCFSWENIHFNPFKKKIKWSFEYIIRWMYRRMLSFLSRKNIKKHVANKNIKTRIENYETIKEKEKSNIISPEEFNEYQTLLDKLYINYKNNIRRVPDE